MRRICAVLGVFLVAMVCCSIAFAKDKPIRVLIWDEMSAPKKVYPDGICKTIADFLNLQPGIQAKTATLDDPDQGLSEAALAQTDVLIWWGHVKHKQVDDKAVDRIVQRVKDGKMGFFSSHSSHRSKPFQKLLPTTGNLQHSKQMGVPEKVIVVTPAHPIASGVKDFTLPQTEPFREPFEVPTPETVIFRSDWGKGDEFRTGDVWTIGKGRVFYFQPGHQTYREYDDPNVQRVFRNGIFWLANRAVPKSDPVLPKAAAKP